MKTTVKDVMTKDVITVHTSTEYKDIVRLIEVSAVSAVPVLDDADRVVGIISEADLLLKEEHHGEARPRFERGKHRVERERASATAGWEIMTAPVVTIGPDESVATAARAMHKHNVKRLPVISPDGRLAGIVSRRDVLSVFMRPDEEIRKEIHEIIERKLWLTPDEAHVHAGVDNGVATLEGRIDRKTMMGILVSMVEGIEGVVAVDNRLSFEVDDTHLRPYTAPPFGVLPYGLRRS